MLMKLLEKITTTSSGYTFDELASGVHVDTNIPTTTITDSLRVTTNDNEQLVVFLKEGLRWPWTKEAGNILQETVKNAAKDLITVFPPPKPKPHDVRHFNYNELEKEHGSDCGVYHFSLWIATGQAHIPNPRTNHNAVISRDVINTAYKLDATTSFFERIAPLIQTIGILFEGVDTDTYKKFHDNYNYLANTTPLKLLQVSGRCCFFGLAVLRNLQAEPHKDVSDAKKGWVAMCCDGDFEGGELVISELRLKIAFKPGDVIFFRSAILQHFILPFDGKRTSFVFFSHANLLETGDGAMDRGL